MRANRLRGRFWKFRISRLRGAIKPQNVKGSLSVNPEGVLLAIAKGKSKVENRFARVAKLADAPAQGRRFPDPTSM
jgi:hypothetical protein